MFAFLEEGLEGATVAVLVNKVEVVGSFESLDEPDNILVLKSRQNVYLVDG